MPGRNGRLRAVVVGGGVVGVSSALHLARRGVQVRLVTEGALCSGASGRSLSWLNSWGIRSQAYHELRLQGIQRYRELAARHATGEMVRFDGGLQWVAPDDVENLRAAHEHMHRVGYPSEWLFPDQVRERVPGVAPAAVPAQGAVFNPAEGWVDLPALVDHLARELVTAGGDITTHAGPADVVLDGTGVRGVVTASSDRIDTDVAVMATGANVPTALRRVGIDVPDATPNALLVRTRPVDVDLRAVLNTPRVALRPAPGGRLVMDSGWSEREVVERADGGYGVPDNVVPDLLSEASAVLDGAPSLEAEAQLVGPKPVPGDGEPVLGAVDGIAGYHVAFTHSGATLGLIAGELVAADVLGELNPLLEPFRLRRFAAAKPAT